MTSTAKLLPWEHLAGQKHAHLKTRWVVRRPSSPAQSVCEVDLLASTAGSLASKMCLPTCHQQSGAPSDLQPLLLGSPGVWRRRASVREAGWGRGVASDAVAARQVGRKWAREETTGGDVGHGERGGQGLA